MIAGALLAIVAIGAVFTLDVQKRRSNEIRADADAAEFRLNTADVIEA